MGVVSEKVPPFAVRVGGVLLPKPLAGHPALELCNTLAGWQDPPEHRREWLTTPAHLAIWAEFTGLVERRPRVDDAVLGATLNAGLGATLNPGLDTKLSAGLGATPTAGFDTMPNAVLEEVLDEVRELRAVAYRLLWHRDASAFPALAEKADAANARTRLVTAADGAARFQLPVGDDPRLPLHAAALAVVDLLGRPARETVKACPGEGCGWLFLDPRGRRTWCTMAVCGNRAKVRAYADRSRGSGS